MSILWRRAKSFTTKRNYTVLKLMLILLKRAKVLLPKEITLFSNGGICSVFGGRFYYQKKLHCSQTEIVRMTTRLRFYYQKKLHCSQTHRWATFAVSPFYYQKKLHCSQTCTLKTKYCRLFYYQKKLHCSQTSNSWGGEHLVSAKQGNFS